MQYQQYLSSGSVTEWRQWQQLSPDPRQSQPQWHTDQAAPVHNSPQLTSVKWVPGQESVEDAERW